MATEAYETSGSERKKIETLFGEVKLVLSRVRLRLRGLSGARDEFLLKPTVPNLKRDGALATSQANIRLLQTSEIGYSLPSRWAAQNVRC